MEEDTYTDAPGFSSIDYSALRKKSWALFSEIIAHRKLQVSGCALGGAGLCSEAVDNGEIN
ncbi:MAG: hypothetical protein ACLURV_01365 [Gallintestinimicrobium sp.]